MENELRPTLSLMVERFGFENVSRALREMEKSKTDRKARLGAGAQKRINRGDGGCANRRLSAVEYVQNMNIPEERAELLGRAAEEFERREFLPTLGDIRSFCEVYGIEEPKSKSRASGIPRIFKFLRTLDEADVKRMLDDRMFSGPAKLGPIADAIRGKAKEYREATMNRA